MVKYQVVVHMGFGFTVGSCLELFYVVNGMVGSRDTEWMQVTLNLIISLSDGTTGSKCRQVKGHEMPVRHTHVHDVGRGGGTAVHG